MGEFQHKKAAYLKIVLDEKKKWIHLINNLNWFYKLCVCLIHTFDIYCSYWFGLCKFCYYISIRQFNIHNQHRHIRTTAPVTSNIKSEQIK